MNTTEIINSIAKKIKMTSTAYNMNFVTKEPPQWPSELHTIESIHPNLISRLPAVKILASSKIRESLKTSHETRRNTRTQHARPSTVSAPNHSGGQNRKLLTRQERLDKVSHLYHESDFTIQGHSKIKIHSEKYKTLLGNEIQASKKSHHPHHYSQKKRINNGHDSTSDFTSQKPGTSSNSNLGTSNSTVVLVSNGSISHSFGSAIGGFESSSISSVRQSLSSPNECKSSYNQIGSQEPSSRGSQIHVLEFSGNFLSSSQAVPEYTAGSEIKNVEDVSLPFGDQDPTQPNQTANVAQSRSRSSSKASSTMSQIRRETLTDFEFVNMFANRKPRKSELATIKDDDHPANDASGDTLSNNAHGSGAETSTRYHSEKQGNDAARSSVSEGNERDSVGRDSVNSVAGGQNGLTLTNNPMTKSHVSVGKSPSYQGSHATNISEDRFSSAADYLYAHSYYERPMEVQPYCHVPKGKIGHLMGWRRAQTESLAWEASWEAPVIHRTVLHKAKEKQRKQRNEKLDQRASTSSATLGKQGGANLLTRTDQKESPLAKFFLGNVPQSLTANASIQRPKTIATERHAAVKESQAALKEKLLHKKSSKDTKDLHLPSLSLLAKPYPYPERQTIDHLDEAFINRVLSRQKPSIAVANGLNNTEASLIYAGYEHFEDKNGLKPFDDAAGEYSFKPMPQTSRGGKRLIDSGGVRAFVVDGSASKTPLENELDYLDLKLHILQLSNQEREYIKQLESILIKDNVKDERTRKLRKKHVASLFRKLHKRVVALVELQSSTEISKTRRAHMQRFLEDSKKNIIFLEVKLLIVIEMNIIFY